MEQFNGDEVSAILKTWFPDYTESMANDQVQPYVEILEQPASKALRFRYECEGRSAGSIPGVNSTPENKTFPSIRIVGYTGPAMVIVSCVTKDTPYRSHPHNLVGKEGYKQGVCTVEIPSGNMVVTFSNLGIQCVKKKDIEEALRIRQELGVDPFQTGFQHKRHPTDIDLNTVRLCFHVYLEGSQKGKFDKPLPPIVSDPIYDKKATSDLVICKLSHCSASIAGGMDMILICEKVAKEDIEVRFFEEKDGQLIWEGKGEFSPTHVYKQTAIAFRTPSYRTQQVEQPVQAYIQLRRPSDGATSEPLSFQMLPLGTDDKRKRPKLIPNRIAVPTETEKHAGNQPISFNIINAEPPERISFKGPGTSTGGFTLQPVKAFSQSPRSMQTFRSQVSPGRTPSPMKYNPNATLIQQSYQPNIQPIIQQDTSVTTDMQQIYQLQLPDQPQLHQPDPNLPMLTRITPEDQGGLNNDTTKALCLLNMDNQQLNFEGNFDDLVADFEANLSTNLSNLSGLSISNSIQMSDTSDSDDESRPYVVVQFVIRGRKGSTKQLDIVPKNWLDWDAKTKKIKCKFLPPPYTEEDSELLHDIVKKLAIAPASWPEYTVEIKAHGKTYADALLKLQLLNEKEFASISNSNENQNEKSKKMENSIRKKKFQKDEERIKELFNSVTTVEEFLHLPNDKSIQVLKKTGEKSNAGKNDSTNLSSSSKCKNSSKKFKKKNKCMNKSATCDGLVKDEYMSFNMPKQINNKNSTTSIKNTSHEESDKDQQCQEKNVLLFDNEIPVISTFPNILTNQLVNEDSADVTQQFKSAIEINNTKMNLLLSKVENLAFDIKKIKNILMNETTVCNRRRNQEKNLFLTQNNINLPLSTEKDFDEFNTKLEMEIFRSEFCAYLRRYVDVDQTLSKNISNKLKMIMSREIALKYTAVKEVNGKKVFKGTRLCQCIEDVYIGLNIKGEYIKDSHILKVISNTLSNAKDWEGHRKDRIKNQLENNTQ